MNTTTLSSAFKESKPNEKLIARYLQLLSRLATVIFLPLLLFSIYKNLIIGDSPAVYVHAAVWVLSLFIAIKPKIDHPKLATFLYCIAFYLAAIVTVLNNDALKSAPAIILMLSPWMLLAFGLRRSLIVSAFMHPSLLVALYIDTESDLTLELVHLAAYLSAQFAVLITTNLSFNMYQHVQRELEDSNQLMELAANGSGIGFFSYDQHSDTWSVNNSYRNLFKISHNRPLTAKQQLIQSTYDKDRPEVERLFEINPQNPDAVTIEHRIQVDGVIRWVRLTVSNNRSQQQPVFYGSIVDIQDSRDYLNELEQFKRRSMIATQAFKQGVIIGDPSSSLLSLDQRSCEIFGFQYSDGGAHIDYDEFILKLSAECRTDVKSRFEKANTSLEVQNLYYSFETHNGEKRWARGVLTGYLDQNNQAKLIALIEDTTEQHNSAERLNEFALKNKALLEQLSLATYEADIRIVDENLTQQKAEFLAKGKSPRMDPPTFKERIKLIPAEYHNAVEIAYQEAGRVVEYPIQGSAYLTGIQWLRLTLIRRYKVGKDEHALLMVSEITKEKKFQQQLERSLKQVEESLLRIHEIASAGNIGLFEWSVDSELMRPNEIFREQTELTRDRYPILSTRDFIRLFNKIDGTELLARLREAEPDAGTLEFKYPIHLVSGTRRFIRVAATAHRSEQGDKRILGSITDLTEHVELEQKLREANLALTQQSRTDPLTQLANRRALDDYMVTQLALRNREPNSDLSVVMIDVDYFKNYNDHYGHPEGDKVLKKIAEVLRSAARRPEDFVARFGGEEFVMILPNTDEKGARTICDTVQTSLEILSLTHKKSPLSRITLSIGIAHLSPMQLTSEQKLLKAADIALYEAKGAGRNCILVQQPILE